MRLMTVKTDASFLGSTHVLWREVRNPGNKKGFLQILMFCGRHDGMTSSGGSESADWQRKGCEFPLATESSLGATTQGAQ